MNLVTKTIRKIVAAMCIVSVVTIANLPLLNAYEAHVINVTATVCNYSEIKSKGFWKVHISDIQFQPFQSQTLGDDTVISAVAAATILQQGDSSIMENKLKAQLLAMKFNIGYLLVGNFLDEAENKTLEEITSEADLILKDPLATEAEMETMKDLLEYWNTKETLEQCSGTSLPPTPVLTDSLVINKVYMHTDSAHKTTNDINEWVEILNPTTSDINLKGWQICDNADCDMLSYSNLILPAGKYAVVTDQQSTWSLWDVPGGALKIVLGGAIGNGLANDTDFIILKNAEEEIVDQMNWGVPNEDWANYNVEIWSPGITGFVKGDILGRNPDGFDTDQVSDWKVYKLPKVTVTVPNGGEVFDVGKTYLLNWVAVNNVSGNDNDLKIDIWYSNDSGKTWGSVVKDTENDGDYNFTVPLCLDREDGSCYWVPSNKARVKVVATDSVRNFMFSNWDASDRDFCPPIDFSLITPEEAAMLAALGITPESSIEEIYAQKEAASTMSIDDFEQEENNEDSKTDSEKTLEASSDEEATGNPISGNTNSQDGDATKIGDIEANIKDENTAIIETETKDDSGNDNVSDTASKENTQTTEVKKTTVPDVIEKLDENEKLTPTIENIV
jgi:hypothetical protein